MATTRSLRRPAALLLTACLAFVPIACSGSDDDADTTAATDGGTATTAARTETTDPLGVPLPPAPTGGVELGDSSLGPATIGEPAAAATDALTVALGAPTASSSWSQPSCEFAGPDSDGASTVSWPGLVVALRGPTPDEATFGGYIYSGADEGPTAGLATPEGITIGSTGTEVADAYGDAASFDGTGPFGPLWTVETDDGQYVMEVDGDTEDAAVVSINLNPIFCD